MYKNLNIRKICLIPIILYMVIGIVFYIIGGQQLYVAPSKNNVTNEITEEVVGEIGNGDTIVQEFTATENIINDVKIKFATYERQNSGDILISLADKDNVYATKEIKAKDLVDNQYYTLEVDKEIDGIKGKELFIKINVENMNENDAITIWSSKCVDKFPTYINGEKTNKTLNFTVNFDRKLWLGSHYFYIFGSGLIILVLLMINIYTKYKNNKKSLILDYISVVKKYEFLISKLVERDFKTKYKRSVLGILWSFLNPILTMSIQYIVFSTLFKSDIPNFPVYLLSGIVVFNFFTESCGIGLMSIVGNASLITKVYVPKYIYPVSRVLSSTINLVLSLIPLFMVMLITKTPINSSIILIIFALLCVIIFSIGMTFILSALMVFFRDTQFLWNVVILLWTYATPLFYPETILPQKFSIILKVNPMYYFIKFIRVVILDGVSPEPMMYLQCIISAFFMLSVGCFVFKKTQDKFILNI